MYTCIDTLLMFDHVRYHQFRSVQHQCFPQIPGSKRVFAMARRRLGCLALLGVLGCFTAFTGHSAGHSGDPPQRSAAVGVAAEGEATHWSTFEDADWVLKCRLTDLTGLGTSWDMFLGLQDSTELSNNLLTNDDE